MKLNPKLIRYLSPEHYRVLTATEMGSRNHEVVPVSLIEHIAQLKTGGVQKILGDLAKNNLVAKVQNIKYDGYRLTYGGYDFLALRTLCRRDALYSVGHQIGVGKESDIQICADEDGHQMVLKMHRLGRTSFRNVKEKRDYLQGRKTKSWLYLSRLSAMKEFAFMKVLYDNDFPVPKPIDFNRHCIVMGLIDAFPLCQIKDCGNPAKLYSDLMNIIVRLARAGLIHGDFNEFNLLVGMDGKPWLIDFPQMVSTSHRNAEMYFDRDVNCIRTYFLKRYHYESSMYPRFDVDIVKDGDLDVQAAASGFFTKKEQQEMEDIQEELRAERGDEVDVEESGEESEYYESDEEDIDLNQQLEQPLTEITISIPQDNADLSVKLLKLADEPALALSEVNERISASAKSQEQALKLGNTYEPIATKGEFLTTILETPSDSDSDSDIEQLNNTLHKAHRDASNPTQLKTQKKQSKFVEKLNADEIKRRVAKGMTTAAPSRKRNSIKATTRRINRETAGCTSWD